MADDCAHVSCGSLGISRAMLWSFKGLKAAWPHESSSRAKMLALVLLVPVGLWLGQGSVEKALLVGAILLVMVAKLLNSAVGRGNRLIWHLPADLGCFKRLPLEHPILTGRKTAESLGCALPGQRNLVLSRGACVRFAGMEAAASPSEAETLAATLDADTFFPCFNPAHGQEIARELPRIAADQPGLVFADYQWVPGVSS